MSVYFYSQLTYVLQDIFLIYEFYEHNRRRSNIFEDARFWFFSKPNQNFQKSMSKFYPIIQINLKNLPKLT